MAEAGFSEQEIATIKAEVDHYAKVRDEVKLSSGDYIDLKAYEPAMRHLIDTYIEASAPRKISPFDGIGLLELIVKTGIARREHGCTCPREAPVCTCGFVQTLRSVSRKPILPGEEELECNPRARSAKLRVAERI